MKLILPNIYGVKVPSDANDFKLFFEFGHTRVSYNNLAEKKIPLTEYTFQNLVLNELVDFKILGTLTKDEISFDVLRIVDKDCGLFKNYKTNNYTFFNVDESFRSALPDEVYFENNKPHPSDIEPTNINHYNALKDAWQTAQENITHKLLILQKLA